MKKKYTTPVCELLQITGNGAVLFNNSLGATEPFGKEDDFDDFEDDLGENGSDQNDSPEQESFDSWGLWENSWQ